MTDTRIPIVDIDSKAEEIDRLVKESGGVRLSVFLPIRNEGSEIQRNAILLCDLLKEARSGLKLAGMEAANINRFLQPLIRFVEDPESLRQEAASVAFLLDERALRRIRLNYLLPASCCVCDRFAIKPLLPVLQLNPTFTALSLNQGGVQVYRGVRGDLKTVEVDGMPQTIDEVAEFDDPEKTLQNHSSTRTSQSDATGSKPVSGFHGQGMPDTYKEDLKKRFFQKVAQAIESFLVDKKDPLLIFGVSGNIGLFKQVHADSQRTYYYSDQDASHWDQSRFSRESMNLLKPEVEHEIAAKIDQVKEAVGRSEEIAGIADCALAAAMGRIESALIAVDEQVYGTCDLDHMRVRFNEDNQVLCEQDLLDFIASETYRHGGSVLALPQDRLPAGRRAIAVRRF